MPESACKIMLVSDDDRSAVAIERAIQVALGGAGVTTLRRSAPLDHPVDAGYDLLLVDVGSNWMETIVLLRQQQPDVPLIALCSSPSETIEAFRAGAQDCLGADEREGPALARAIRHAIERSRFQLNFSESGEQVSQDREHAKLGSLGSPALPTTERSYRRLSWGSRSGGSSPTTPFRADRQPQGNRSK